MSDSIHFHRDDEPFCLYCAAISETEIRMALAEMLRDESDTRAHDEAVIADEWGDPTIEQIRLLGPVCIGCGAWAPECECNW